MLYQRKWEGKTNTWNQGNYTKSRSMFHSECFLILQLHQTMFVIKANLIPHALTKNVIKSETWKVFHFEFKFFPKMLSLVGAIKWERHKNLCSLLMGLLISRSYDFRCLLFQILYGKSFNVKFEASVEYKQGISFWGISFLGHCVDQRS